MSGRGEHGTFAEDIEAAAEGEPIEAVVVGGFGWRELQEEDPSEPGRGTVVTWAQARPFLDYAYNDGFGAPRCHAVWAWTASRVIFVSTYDGATTVESVPRNPQGGEPTMPGGG